MSGTTKNEKDRRVKRTKLLVFEAFFQMVQSSRYDELKTIHIIEKSGIGKSTFYEHFAGKDDVLSKSLEYPMSVFASSLIGGGDHENTKGVLNHFWERRMFARVILQHPTRSVVDSCLRSLIVTELASEVTLNANSHNYAKACLLSSGFLSLLYEWLVGRLNLSVEDMLVHIAEFSLKKR